MGDVVRPVTRSEFLLANLIDEVRGLRADIRALRPAAPDPGERVTLREPARVGEPIPDNLPGAAALRAAGIATLADIPRQADALTAIKGIGPATAAAILKAL